MRSPSSSTLLSGLLLSGLQPGLCALFGKKEVVPPPVASYEGLDLATAEQFDEAISGTNAVFVKFHAPWCGHCKAMTPAWHELSVAELEDVVIAKVDCTENGEVAKRMGIQGFPTLKLISGNNYFDYMGDRKNVTALKEFAEGGYKDTPPFVLPTPPTLLQRLPAMLLGEGFIEDVSHIMALRKNAAAMLYVVGLLSGLAIAVGGMALMGANAGGRGGGSGGAANKKATSGKIATGKTSTRSSPRKTSRTRKEA